jgi:hypothetical protein
MENFKERIDRAKTRKTGVDQLKQIWYPNMVVCTDGTVLK